MRSKDYYWFRLFSANGFGAKSIHYIYKQLRENKMNLDELFRLTIDQLEKYFPEIGRGKFSRANLTVLLNEDDEQFYNQYQKLKEDKVQLVTLDDERYPNSVLENLLDSAPPLLFCKGYLQLLNAQGISIVGSRDVDDFAVMLTKSIASKLAEHGYNVTSGYAKGVDTSAHLGALEAGGTTTMILSFGINHISIRKEIKSYDWEKTALFVSQFAPYDKFSGQNAMVRNKLVCAMSRAIVVIASGPEKDSDGKLSGTFDAGKSALKMNIPVFVLNPEILKPIPQGNIDLINMGGIPFSNGNDIITILEERPQQLNVPTEDNSKKSPISVQISFDF